MLSNIVEVIKLNKYYSLGKEKFHALKDVNLEIEQGDFVMIMGKSGSGKTTLMNLLGLLALKMEHTSLIILMLVN